MKRYIKFTIGGISLFFLGVGIGCLLSIPIRVPASGGPIADAPDNKFWATAYSWQEKHFLGCGNRTYSEFEIKALLPNPTVVRRVRIEDTAQSPSIDWREEGNVRWITNSSAVTFSYDGPQTSFQITLKTEPMQTNELSTPTTAPAVPEKK